MQIRSLIYGPDDRITAAIASWQLIHSNSLFDTLKDHLNRSMHRPQVYVEGEESNNGLVVLSIDDWMLGRWKLVESFWVDFLIHCENLFVLDYECMVINLSANSLRQNLKSKNSTSLLKTPPLTVINTAEPIPGTERPFLAL